MLDIDALPDDVAGPKCLVFEHHAASLGKDMKLREKRQQIEHVKFQLAKLRYARFGQSSEQMDSGQLPLTLKELKVAAADAERTAELQTSAAAEGQPAAQSKHIQAFVYNSCGQIAIGEIPPIRRHTLAAEGKSVRVALVCRDNETVAQLLLRLDASFGKAIAENIAVN